MDALKLVSRRKILRIFITGIIAFGCYAGCDQLSSQADVESKVAVQLVTWMKLHDAVMPQESITNLVQIFPFVKHGYPYKEHHDLQQFGKAAGFTNSLVEKYIFFWPRLNHKLLEGDVICISAQPFRWYRDGLCRIYIAKLGNDYVYRPISEDAARTCLLESISTIVPLQTVTAPPAPPPELRDYMKPSFTRRVDRFIWAVAGALGQDSTTGVRWMLALGALLIFGVLAGFVIRGFRLRRTR